MTGGVCCVVFCFVIFAVCWLVLCFIFSMIFGWIVVYGSLLGVGHLSYSGSTGFLLISISIFASVGLFRTWK